MERLTQRINGTAIYPDAYPFQSEEELAYQPVIEKLAAYEDAEEAGLLARLPCKIGDRISYLTGRDLVGNVKCVFNRVEESKVCGYYYDKNGIQVQLAHDWKGNHGTYGIFGTTIFLTREAAEAALKERGERDA